MNVGDLNKVREIKALKKPGQEIAKQVQPIMRRHRCIVKGLSEFCGGHLKLRFRRPNRDWDFFPFNQVLDTMLHELCNNAHGPHNASFYKLWDELRRVILYLLHYDNAEINNFVECTLLNWPLAPVCEVCSSQKLKDVTTKYRFWSCKFCTMENCVMLDKCSACDRWRYSCGRSSATNAPYLGT